MKTNMAKLAFLLLVGLTLTSCVINNPKFFSNTLETKDPSYGYSPENPIAIKNADLNNSIGSSRYYISRLRTEKDNKLKMFQRFSVANPNYSKPAIPLTNRYTGQPLNYGTGPILDYYILISEKEKDTIKLYINPYQKGDVKVPVGLKFEKE